MGRLATGSIAGVALTCNGAPAMAHIIDGFNFSSSYTGNVSVALDGTVYVQELNIGVKSVSFGVSLDYCPITLYQSIITAINANRTNFRVIITDEVDTIDVMCSIAYGAQWVTHGDNSGGIIKGVEFRFIATGVGA